MTTLNLSGIKKVGFIENFDKTKGYPEFGIKRKPMMTITTESKIRKSIPKWKKKLIKSLKLAKKEFKSKVGSNYKPKLLVSTKLS